MEDESEIGETKVERRKRFNRWLIVALVAAVLAGILLASSVWDTGIKGSENAIETNEAASADADPQAWCAAQSTYDAIRRELFRRAAGVRGSDEQAYARLADFALLRISGPIVRGVDDRLNSVTCSGTAVLGLPPGVAVAGGRRSLSGDLDYMVQPAADGTGNVVRLGNADSIVVPLATVSRTRAAEPTAPAELPDLENEVTEDQTELPDQMEQPQPMQANPSFDCDDARSRSEIAVCNDPGLASLDRQMAAQFNRAMMEADRGQRRLLERTRDRFLSYRNRCSNNECIANTYRSRMREISDIVADRWRG
ncbi:MAG TPA: hypothetical protein VHN55_11020 [Sphingomicrobium sp.]|nr:hypothetical protein [Sphingomicrobium sp.]